MIVSVSHCLPSACLLLRPGLISLRACAFSFDHMAATPRQPARFCHNIREYEYMRQERACDAVICVNTVDAPNIDYFGSPLYLPLSCEDLAKIVGVCPRVWRCGTLPCADVTPDRLRHSCVSSQRLRQLFPPLSLIRGGSICRTVRDVSRARAHVCKARRTCTAPRPCALQSPSSVLTTGSALPSSPPGASL